MLISRGVNILRATCLSRGPIKAAANLRQVRSSHEAYYRENIGYPDKIHAILGEGIGAVMWWWVMWHLYHESAHITGEWEYPEPSKWTDADLGIPPEH